MEKMTDSGTTESEKELLKAVWNAGEQDTASAGKEHTFLGWTLCFVGLMLVCIVATVAWLAIRRSEIAMTHLMEEKGASLMMSFESALRTGMRGATGLQLQTLFEEMTRSPDIEFVSVTMPDGIILVHSDRSRTGETMMLDNQPLSEERIKALGPQDTEKSVQTVAEGTPVILVYRNFTLGEKQWPKGLPEPVIFLGLDAAPFEITRAQNRNYVIILSVITLILGLTGLLVFSFAQKAAHSRRTQTLAEDEIARLSGEIRRNEKMAAIGTLAAGVAHEIRNPLSSIKGYATYFFSRFPEGSEDRDAARVMVREVDRLNRVITDLLGLSNQAKIKLARVNLVQVCRHVLRLLRENASSRHIDLQFFSAKHVPEIEGDMEKIAQALLNLCLNALEAMPDGGILKLLVSGGKKYVCVMVADTGSGIAPETLERIFDPYFTTKGSGTGLGLPMAHKIITAHKGRYKVKSRQKSDNDPSSGTIFYIWFPVDGQVRK